MTDFVIEKNIPLPLPRGKGSGIKAGLISMEVGDSVFFEGWTNARACGSVAGAKKNSDRQYTTRKVDGGVRVWRTA